MGLFGMIIAELLNSIFMTRGAVHNLWPLKFEEELPDVKIISTEPSRHSSVATASAWSHNKPVLSPTNAYLKVCGREQVAARLAAMRLVYVSHQRWIAVNVQIHLCQAWIKLLTVALEPRGDIIRSPKQGYQWPLLAFLVVCLIIISEWSPLSHRLLWFWWIES